jgi:hypothetical protein
MANVRQLPRIGLAGMSATLKVQPRTCPIHD